MFQFLNFAKLFGDSNLRYIRSLQPIVDKINSLEQEFEKLPDEKLREKTEEFKNRLKSETLDDILPEAFALVREAAKRTLGQRHFDVQMLGGIVLHRGQIAEMKTGEGKTLTSTLAVYLNALTGKGAHVVTVNDYLARRDVVWMGQIYHALGLTTACINHETAFLYDPNCMSEISNSRTDIDKQRDTEGSFKIVQEFLRPVSRREAYRADITYGTNNEFGFDYLRDNLTADLNEMAQRDFNYAIVDEVDSILIDEARTPLIISAPAEESTELYYKCAELVQKLKENEDYNVDEKMKAATLTEAGMDKLEKWLNVKNLYAEGGIELVHHIEQALKAWTLFRRDRDYVVRDGEVIIVDEFTGRLMLGRRYSEGLHQAIEAKEGVEVLRESRTLATVTFQNYFRMYQKLAGMTGTALTEAEEFSKIYNLEVVSVPTNKPMIRKNFIDRIYATEETKFQAIVRDIKERSERGQPILVGTISIEKNERLSHFLEIEGIPHNVLNAKNHEKEAEIIAQAGKLGAVTVATNMAGRGVDIILGGNPPNPEEAEKIKGLGGLHVLGTERHESRRIDNQLRGRSGRQGDPGSSQFYVSLEDDLMRIFASDRMRNVIKRLGLPPDMPIENKMVAKALESAQSKVEGNNFDIRKHLLEYDDVLNKHREAIYRRRKEMLSAADLSAAILELIEGEIEQVVFFHTPENSDKEWDIEEIYEVANTIFPVPSDLRVKLEEFRCEESVEGKLACISRRTQIIEYLAQIAKKAYSELKERVAKRASELRITIENPMLQIERGVTLRVIDTLWTMHLSEMDHLRQGIGLRGYGQRDPLIEYKREAYKMFTELNSAIDKQIVYTIYKVDFGLAAASPMARPNVKLEGPQKTQADGERQLFKTGAKIGRNDPCPCGAKDSEGHSIKYKRCHGK